MKHNYVVVVAALCLIASGCTHVATVQLGIWWFGRELQNLVRQRARDGAVLNARR